MLRRVARPFLAAPFILDGLSAVRSPEQHVERAQAVKPLTDKVAGRELSEAQLRRLTQALGVTTTCAGVCLAFGRLPRTSAAVLTTVGLPMAFVNNPVWQSTPNRQEAQRLRSNLVKQLALTAGMALAVTDREGRPSASWRRAQARSHRQEIAQVRAAERERFERTLAQ